MTKRPIAEYEIPVRPARLAECGACGTFHGPLCADGRPSDTEEAKGAAIMTLPETAKAGIDWANLTPEELQSANRAPCLHCGHPRQWHLWGDTCRKTADCVCTTFKASN